MRLNSGQNLHQFLTNSKSVGQKSYSNYSKIYNNTKIYNQSKSNSNIINIENSKNKYNLFSNLNVKQKDKINLTKFLKEDKNYYNNINLMTEQNKDKKSEVNKINLNLSVLSNLSKRGNSFKTLNYDKSSYARIMKYFTIKSTNKPLKLDDLSPIFVPIRNNLSNEHRKNSNININQDNIKDKINFYYYINSKEKVMQLFKDKKNNNNSSKSIINSSKYNSSIKGKNSSINSNYNNNENNSGNYSDNNKMDINKNEQRNNIIKPNDNNLTFSKNSNESEFTFKDKGSNNFNNIENKKNNNNKDNSNDNNKNILEKNNNNILNAELNLFVNNNIIEKENKKVNDIKQLLINNLIKDNEELIQNVGSSGKNQQPDYLEKIFNKEKYDINYNNYNKKNKYKYNNFIKNEEQKTNNYDDSTEMVNDIIYNNFITKENLYKNMNDEKSSNLFENIINMKKIDKNKKFENDVNSNHIITIDNKDNINNKNYLKNSYQFRIRKINLPSGINITSIQHNNKLLQNIMNKKSKKIKGILNSKENINGKK